ncbi:MAG: calcium-binding protein [Aliishimia sp.]
MQSFFLADRNIEDKAVVISDDHFGVNVVTTYDQEFGQNESELSSLVSEMGANTLRFPGGSATENYFDMTDPNSAVSADPDSPALLPMDDFFSAAGNINVDVQLVVPTRVGFQDSAVEALRKDEYGERDQLEASYLSDVETFVREAFAQAAANGVDITTLEIGNEFWGSGQMTAAEYGWLAGRLAVHLEDILQDLGLNDTVTIAAQSTASSSDIYAPRDDVHNFIETVNGIEELRSQAYVDKHFNGIPPSHYEPVTIPGQGSAAGQLNAMIAEINAVPGAAAALDGVILHLYQRKGLDGVDGGRAYVFDQLENFETRLDRPTDAPAMSYHLTEWNVSTGNHDDNAGLQHASMLIETMYEMAIHNVTDAQIWPLTFNAAQGTSLVDLNDNRLAIAGEMFKLMSESLPDLTPILDWSVEDVIDIHGFANNWRVVLFVSERTGEAQSDIQLHTGNVVESTKYVMTMTELWDGGAGGDDDRAEPVITQSDGRTVLGDQIVFDLNDWANLRIELTAVGAGHDEVNTYGGDDRIFTYGGQDRVSTEEGNDYIHAGNGDDRIWAGAGNDHILGGFGDDTITGGSGRDTFVFQTDHGNDRIIDFQFGLDILRIKTVDVFSFTDFSAIGGLDFAFTSEGMRIWYGNSDSILLQDNAAHTALDSGGRFDGTNTVDVLLGGSGNDDLRGKSGADYLEDGAGRDFLRGGNGSDYFVLVADGEHDTITDFQINRDQIDITAWNVDDFSQLQIEVDYNGNGDWNGRGYITFEDEELRIDGMDEAMLAALNSQHILI